MPILSSGGAGGRNLFLYGSFILLSEILTLSLVQNIIIFTV
jgi:hypothetical protein